MPSIGLSVLLSMEPLTAIKNKKSLKLVCRCLQLPSKFLDKGNFPRESRQPRLSANDKGDHEMIQFAVQRSTWIYQMAEENPWKPRLGDCLMKAVRPIKWDPLPPNVGRIAQQVSEE